MDWMVNLLKTFNITVMAETLLKILEDVEEVDNLTEEEVRSCVKLFVCACDKRHVVGIKNRLKVLAM